MNLIDAHEADFRVLGRLYETDKLHDGAVHHTYNKLGGNHHAESDLSVDDGCRVAEGIPKAWRFESLAGLLAFYDGNVSSQPRRRALKK